ncbi:MAG: TfoX/Sxy family protein [Bacteroidota bacterium]
MKKVSFHHSKLSKLKNIGKTIEKRLNEIGVYSKEDLETIGPVKAYRLIKENYPDKTIPVCYYLYSFEGALLNRHWDDIPEETKEELKKAAGV